MTERTATAPPPVPKIPPAQQRRRTQRLLDELGVGPGHGRPIPRLALADAMGISRTHWSKICNGERQPVSTHPGGRWPTWEAFETDVRAAAAKLASG